MRRRMLKSKIHRAVVTVVVHVDTANHQVDIATAGRLATTTERLATD